MSVLSLGVDSRMLNGSGIGVYLEHLLRRISADSSIRLTLLGDAERILSYPWAQSESVRTIPLSARVYSVREQWELPLRMPRAIDGLWTPHYVIPLTSSKPLVVTVHDIAHLAVPYYSRSRAKRWYARSMLEGVRHRARRVLCDSHYTADELIRYTGINATKLEVVHLGVDHDWYFPDASEAPPHPKPYLVFVGNVKPHKNLRRLLAAYASIAAEIEEDLVIVGRRDGFLTGDPEVADFAVRLGERVQFTGYVDDRTLRSYLRGATALVFPSLYEGFGLPALEAMACGRPVIASSAASIPEVCGDAAQYCDPYDIGSIADAMRSVATSASLRSELVELGLVRAGQFSWDRCAETTRDVLKNALAS